MAGRLSWACSEDLLPGGPELAIAPGLAALGLMVVLLVTGTRLPSWALAALGPIGVALIGYALATTAGAGDAAVLYMWPVLWVAYFFGRTGASCRRLGGRVHGLALIALPAGVGNLDRWLDVMVSVSVVAGVVYALSQNNRKLLARLAAEARVDKLTGVLNRRGFEERLEVEVDRARREQASLGVATFDIDHFKRINDDFGHEVGDQVLAHLGAVLAAKTRTTDVVARTGGEEFVALLQGRTGPGRWRTPSGCARRSRSVSGLDLPPVTVSAGVTAEHPPGDVAQLLQRLGFRSVCGQAGGPGQGRGGRGARHRALRRVARAALAEGLTSRLRRCPQPPRTAPPPRPRRLPPEDFELKEIVLHGHRVAYRSAGSGPAIVLVHGITSDSSTWERAMPYLATRFTVIAPDLIGHGESAKPRGDYSLGAYASGVRDLMVTLGHESATFVGHSLGGGIVMQLAYQFPERCERLVLVDSGGLGRDVSFLLRAATLPFSEVVLPLLASTRLLDAGRAVSRLLGRVGLHAGTDMAELGRGHASLSDPEARSAFINTLRTIVDPARPAGERERPPLPRREHPVPAGLGRARPDHPGGARPGGARAGALQPARDLRGRRPLPAHGRPAALPRRAARLHRLDRARRRGSRELEGHAQVRPERAVSGSARPASGLFADPREITELGDLFANIWQVCWVTRDLERGMELLRERFGIEHCVEVPTDGATFLRGDEPAEWKARVAMGARGGPIVELIEPVAGEVDFYREFLPVGRLGRPAACTTWRRSCRWATRRGPRSARCSRGMGCRSTTPC